MQTKEHPSLEQSSLNKYQTLASNAVLISVGTFGSKLLVFLMVRFYTRIFEPCGLWNGGFAYTNGKLADTAFFIGDHRWCISLCGCKE